MGKRVRETLQEVYCLLSSSQAILRLSQSARGLFVMLIEYSMHVTICSPGQSGSFTFKFSDIPFAGFHPRGIRIIKVKHTFLAHSVSVLSTIGLNPVPNRASRAAVTACAIPKACFRTFGSQLQSNRFYLTRCLVKRRKHPLKVRSNMKMLVFNSTRTK